MKNKIKRCYVYVAWIPLVSYLWIIFFEPSGFGNFIFCIYNMVLSTFLMIVGYMLLASGTMEDKELLSVKHSISLVVISFFIGLVVVLGYLG